MVMETELCRLMVMETELKEFHTEYVQNFVFSYVFTGVNL